MTKNPPLTFTTPLSNGEINATGFFPDIWKALQKIANFK